LGDRKYGRDNKFSRMALHAYRLGFTHPRTGKFIEIKTAIPQDFVEAISSR